MAAVIIASRQFDREVGHSEFFIDADLAPHTRIAGVGSRIVLPGFGAIFVRQRDGMENPETLSSPGIESPDVALHIFLTHRNAARFVRRADDYRVARDDRRGMESDVRAHQIDFLIVLELQIDRTVSREARTRMA